MAEPSIVRCRLMESPAPSIVFPVSSLGGDVLDTGSVAQGARNASVGPSKRAAKYGFDQTVCRLKLDISNGVESLCRNHKRGRGADSFK